MAELKLLLATTDFPPSTGGIAVLMDNLVRNAKGARARVLAFDEPGAAELDGGRRLDVRRFARADMRRQLAVPILNMALLREVRRYRPDVVLSGHVVCGIGAIVAKRVFGVPVVQYLHADEFRVRGRLTGWIARGADAVIAVSSYTRQLALAAGVESERVHVIHPGVEFPPAPPPRSRSGAPTILTVASFLSPRKGHDVIVEALPSVREAVPGVRWVVIGDGPLRQDIERSAAAAGLGDAVSFLGRVDDVTRDRWLDEAHVFCMPSRVPDSGAGGEGFGIVYLEAGAHGLPAVGGNVAGAIDAVVDGETGVLVDPTDHMAVAAALIELLANPERARKMGAAGRVYAERHSWPRVATEVEEVLREVAGR